MRHTQKKRKELNKTRKQPSKTRPFSSSKDEGKQFLFNPNNPKKSFNVYIDKNPKDTIPIKYKTVDNVKNTITKLEHLYKAKKYPHKRIWQVGMIMKVRLEVLSSKKPQEYKLARKYFTFLSNRTDLPEDERYKSTFIF